MNSEHIPNGQVSEAELLHKQLLHLATSMATEFYPEVPQFRPLDDALGILSQIDNMTTGLTRRSSAGVKVKALEWVEDMVGGGVKAGEYRVRAGIWTHGYYWTKDDNEARTGFEDEDAAKAAAQADFNTRILSALSSPAHIGEDEVVAWRYSSGWVTGADMVKLWLHTADPVLAAKEAASGNAVQPLYLRPSPSVPPQGETKHHEQAWSSKTAFSRDQFAKLAFAIFYSSNLCAPQNIEAVIREIDTCGNDCEHAGRSGCSREERGDYCPFSLAEDLRKLSAALYGPNDPSGYVASVFGPDHVSALTPSPTLEPTDAEVERATHRHVKRGSEYVLIGIGRMQAEGWHDPSRFNGKVYGPDVDMREVAIYRSATDPTEIWVRPREEFEDGRFEVIASRQPTSGEGV